MGNKICCCFRKQSLDYAELELYDTKVYDQSYNQAYNGRNKIVTITLPELFNKKASEL